MPASSVTIWYQQAVRCTVSVSGSGIVVHLLDGEAIIQERIVNSADHALSVAEIWKAERQPVVPRGRRRRAPAARPAPRPAGFDSALAVPRVMWIDGGR